jgi:hypothetical protein
MKKTIIGDFKPKRRFLNFISTIKGTNVRLISDYAFIKGESLSGMLDGLKFKITICSEGTIKFEEVDTKYTNKEQIQRLIDDIDSMDVSGYAQKFIIPLEFFDSDGIKYYLEVEHERPIDILKSIFNDEDGVNISKKSISIIDSLLSDEELKTENTEITKIDNEDITCKDEDLSKSYIKDQFNKINQEKIEELKKRLDENEKESINIKRDIKQLEIKLEKLNNDISITENRLKNFNIKDDNNGYVFHVSDEYKTEINLTDDNKKIIDKIADLIGLKKDIIYSMLYQGYYKIFIAKKDDIKSNNVEMPDDILNKIKSLILDKDSKITVISPGEFEYRGNLNWHDIVNKLINKGFEQDPEFEKHCNSNSYTSEKSGEMIKESLNIKQDINK